MTTSVDQGGTEHTATMTMILDIKDGDKDKPLKADVTWKDLLLDGAQAVPDNSWSVVLNGQGAIADSDATEGADAIKKMLAPMTFVYPDKPVAVGDTWTNTVKAGSDKSDESITVDMKADSLDKVGDVDALKITETLTQKGDGSLKGTGTWWVDKTGKVLKFETKVSNWMVPMAGDQAMDASFKGSIAK
jgi:hypothetical protein